MSVFNAFLSGMEMEELAMPKVDDVQNPMENSPYQFAVESYINEVNLNGETALHFAVDRGNREACEYLLSNGARCNSTSSEGRTPLHIAAERGNEELYDLLLAHGADETVIRKDGKTPSECRPEECSICFEPLLAELGKIRQCPHIFHKGCLVGWLQKSNECPYCRTIVGNVDDVVSDALVARPRTALMYFASKDNLSDLICSIDNHRGIFGAGRAYMINSISKSPLFATALVAGGFIAVLAEDDPESVIYQAFESSYFFKILDKISHLIKR